MMDFDRNRRFFVTGFIAVQALSAISLVLTGIWTQNYLGGFSWQSDPHKEFNYHIFFMVLGFVTLNESGMLVYRLLRYCEKRTLKALHAVFFGGAFIFTVVALKAVFDSHNLREKPTANMYTLHSWIGLGAVIMFAAQACFGFLLFILPFTSRFWRVLFLPNHIFFGSIIYILSIASCLSGINEKIIFRIGGKGYQELPALAAIGNAIGVILTVKAILVLFLVLRPEYKREPLAEEEIQEIKEF